MADIRSVSFGEDIVIPFRTRTIDTVVRGFIHLGSAPMDRMVPITAAILETPMIRECTVARRWKVGRCQTSPRRHRPPIPRRLHARLKSILPRRKTGERRAFTHARHPMPMATQFPISAATR